MYLPMSSGTVIDNWNLSEDELEGCRHVAGKHFTMEHVHETFIENTKNLTDRLTVIENDSSVAMVELINAKQTFDFIYVDASHTSLDCAMDLALAWVLLKPNGLLGIDDYLYYNTLVVINQPWVLPADNPFGQPEIKAKGGEALWLASSIVFLFGNQKKSGISHITATKNGRTISYAVRTKVSILKNHVNGISYKDGKLIAVPQGYIKDDKTAIDKYKKEYSEYWNRILGNEGDIIFKDDTIPNVVSDDED
jgi:hypothetical protein